MLEDEGHEEGHELAASPAPPPRSGGLDTLGLGISAIQVLSREPILQQRSEDAFVPPQVPGDDPVAEVHEARGGKDAVQRAISDYSFVSAFRISGRILHVTLLFLTPHLTTRRFHAHFLQH